MRKIFVFLSMLLLLRPVYAGCVSASRTTKCARLPEYELISTPVGDMLFGSYITDAIFSDPVVLDDKNYTHVRNGVPITGVLSSYNKTGLSYIYYVDCEVTSPFSAKYRLSNYYAATELDAPVELCADINNVVDDMLGNDSGLSGPESPGGTQTEDMYVWDSIPTALPGDACPDGFYTVPYDVSCGEGMIDTADIPNCDDDTSGEYCLISDGVSCESYSDCGDMSFTNANGVYTLSYTACNGGMCSDASTTDVACGNGYYGNGTTCTKCPGDGTSNTPGYTENNDGTLAIINNASLITDCYVTPNVYFRDGVGKYRFRNNCNYAE